ncbi:MAG: YdhK family protein [Alkalibacterium sp.]|uniref:YdhK family protein n=1 Tax=Alkalibacterium sp. TaxID=1872447 RepID=UPI003970B42C
MKRLLLLGLSTTFIMMGCSDTNDTTDTTDSTDSNTEMNVAEDETVQDEMTEIDEVDEMVEMDHDGELPTDLKKAEDPAFPEGSNAIITAKHMPGMEGAEATIAGAFDTTVYEVSYTPTTGGERVIDHRWVIQEDLAEGTDIAEAGDEVILDVEHIEGMQGATAIVEEAYTGTIYAVDYTSTTDGEKVTDHMWVTEDELEALEE